MLRALALLAVAANLLFAVWAVGLLTAVGLPPPGAGQREPWRLERELQPQSVVVLNPSASTARPSPPLTPGTGTGAPASGVAALPLEPPSSAAAQPPGRESELGQPGR